MNESVGERSLEAETILSKIVEDFERLEGAIDAAIARLLASSGRHDDIEALLRAKEAVRKGAALAREKMQSK